jgi:hypothetical protein
VAGALVNKSLHYKRAMYLQAAGNFQNDLKKAVLKAKTVGDRKQIVNAAESTFLLLNSVRNRWSMTFGSLLLYSRGRNQPLVTEDDSAEELTVEQLAPPPDKAGARRDFVESLLFFGAQNNHVVLVQSSGLRARHFETYLDWLLQEKTATIDQEDRIQLADHPSKRAISEVLKSPVRSVSVGLPLESQSTGGRATTRRLSFEPKGLGFGILSKILGADWLNKLRLDESLDESRLKVEVNVTYTRKTDDAAQDLLNDIALQLRNQEPEDVEIVLKSGAKLKGEALKVTGQISVQTYGGLIAPDDLFPKMRDWLKTQLEEGAIDA